MITVESLLKIKGSEVYTVTPQTHTLQALELMAAKGVGALVVLENDALVGIISERDFARQTAKNGSCRLEEPVSAIMTRKVFTVAPVQTIDECMTIMTDHRVRHLPVVNSGALVGIISIGDVVKQVIADRELLIHSLENYILGRKT